MAAEPYGEACLSCGLYRTHAGQNIVQVTEDSRGTPYKHRVLVLLPAPTPAEAYSGRLFTDEGSSWVLDFLNNSEFEWLATTVILCNQPTDFYGKSIKVEPKTYSHCANAYLSRLINEYQPHAILALGGESLSAVWPSNRGKPPSLTKARLAPVRLGELYTSPWLVTSYSPRMHGWWLDSGGKRGQDLTEEYIRVWELLHSILEGGYTVLRPDWKLIQSCEEVKSLATYLNTHNIDELILDTENATWIGRNIRPWKVDPDGLLPSRLSVWHPDNELVCFGFTIYHTNPPLGASRYESWVIFMDESKGPRRELFLRWLGQLFHGRVVSAWNNISDFQDLFIFLGMDVECGDDGFLLRGLRDSSRTNNGLKETSGELLTVPMWDDQLDLHLDLEKKRKTSQKLPPLACLAELPREITGEYNAHDHFYTAVLLKEHLTEEKLGEEFPWVAYDQLRDGLPWLMQMERNGVPVDEELLNATLDEVEDEEAALLAQLRSYEEVQRAELRSGRPFNIDSPIFYDELIREWYGEPDGLGGFSFPDWFPRTPTGQLSRAEDVFVPLAGNSVKEFVPVESKSRTQLFWHRVMAWKECKVDFSKLMGLLDYAVDGRIHARCRILRTDVASDGEEGGGAVSGRFAFSPNIGNLKKTRRYLRSFRAPRGYTWLRYDYGRIELAWLAWNTQDPLMLQWAMEGIDQHRARGGVIWSLTFGKPIQEFYDQPDPVIEFWREKGKTQNFADVYLEEPETTANKLGISVDEVIHSLRQSQLAHPKILSLKKQIYDTCQAGGFVRSTMFGRQRSAVGWIPNPQTADEFFSLDQPCRDARIQTNCAIFRSLWNTRAAQADASDTTFCTGKHIHYKLLGRDWLNPDWVESINFIHDSLDFLVPNHYVDVAKPALLEEVKRGPQIALPIDFPIQLPVDVQEGEGLADFLKK